ncbi:MAG: GntG family PLP-dependent aldolase [Myxococcota bacterium]
MTKPSPAMRRAMAEAEVGDDVYREDPTVRTLEAEVAAHLGKEAALFVPSGTMANQIALLCHTRPGDEVICGRGAHCAYYESGAGGAWSGVQFEQTASPFFSAEEMRAAAKPRAYYCPRTSLVAVENTHNRGGGTFVSAAELAPLAAACRELELAMHLDGARLWNAAAALDCPTADLAAPFDTVSVCFSKGLGAPIGSALVGPQALIEDAALRFRKMLGGGMRQVGVIAAGALFAFRHHRDRLHADHEAARRLAVALRDVAGVEVPYVPTNIVLADVPVAAERVVAAATARGVAFYPFGPRRLRLVTHRDVVDADDFDEAVAATVDAFAEALAA